MSLSSNMQSSHRLRKTHQPIKGSGVSGEIQAFQTGNSESMGTKRESGNNNVILDDVTGDLTCAVRNGERSAGVFEGTTGLRSKEVMVSLQPQA